MLCRESFLDPCLSGEQPIQCLVEFVFLGILYGKFFGECAVVPEPCGGQFGSRVQETFDQHGQHQIAFAAGLGTEEWLEGGGGPGGPPRPRQTPRERKAQRETFCWPEGRV